MFLNPRALLRSAMIGRFLICIYFSNKIIKCLTKMLTKIYEIFAWFVQSEYSNNSLRCILCRLIYWYKPKRTILIILKRHRWNEFIILLKQSALFRIAKKSVGLLNSIDAVVFFNLVFCQVWSWSLQETLEKLLLSFELFFF